VGNTTGLPATGDAYRTVNPMPSGASEISTRAGETFSYNTDPNDDPAANKTVRTQLNIDLTGWDTPGDQISINGITYSYNDYPGLWALVAAINTTAGNNGVFCKDISPTEIVLYTSGNTSAGVTFVNAGTGVDLSSRGVSASDFMAAVNSGVGELCVAKGALVVPGVTASGAGNIVFNPPAGSAITAPIIIPVAVGEDATTIASHLAANAVFNANFTATVRGNTIFIEAITAGDDFNMTIELQPSGASMGLASTPTLVGGYDATANVQMSQNADGTMLFSRLDQGANAVLHVDNGNTIANGTFSMQQAAFAMDQEEPYSTNSDTTGPHRKGVRELSFSWLNATGAHQTQSMLLDFIPNITSPTTQSAGASETFYLDQDGAPKGTLDSIDIGRDGLITGSFSNGQVKLMGSVILYNFACPEQLKREGENLWSVTLGAGSEVWGRPGQGRMGNVQSGALEKSNVDLANEMVNMINYQRAFQANSKTIQTTDQLLQELINLKR
jgi:flagellar hook protein FlgE